MTPFEIAGGIILILVSILVIIVVSLQESRQGNPSAVMGGTDSYFDKNNTRTKERVLGKITKICLVLFLVVSLGINVLNVFTK